MLLLGPRNYHSLEVYQDHLQQSAISLGELAAERLDLETCACHLAAMTSCEFDDFWIFSGASCNFNLFGVLFSLFHAFLTWTSLSHFFRIYMNIYIYYICDMNYAFQCFSFIHLKYHHRKPVGGYVFDLVIWCRQMLISWWMATTFGHHILRPLPVETWRNNNRWWWKMPSLTGKRLGWLNICKCLDWLYEY